MNDLSTTGFAAGTTALSAEEHPYLTGIFTPAPGEMTLTDLEVTGEIPQSLSGRYVRIGPNPVKPDPAKYHLFVGDGMVHGIRLSNGKVEWYRNRFIRSRGLEAAGGPPAAPGPRRGLLGDVVNTNIIQIAGRTTALVEAGCNPAILNDELETVAYSDFGGTLKGPYSAHPHLDVRTNELHTVTYDTGRLDTVWHVVVDNATGKVTRETPVTVEHGPAVHDCAFTERYVVIIDLPLTFSAEAHAGGYTYPFTWKPGHKARVGLLPRNGASDEVIWCDVPPCWVFHTVNAYDRDDGKVVLDLSPYDSVMEQSLHGPEGLQIGFERWIVDPVAKIVERKTVDRAPQEFPRPDDRFFGVPYRYAWSIAIPTGEPAFPLELPLYLYDMADGTRKARSFGPTHIPGEFIFVPRSEAAPEGDGWVMGLVIDVASGTTDLVILDALDIEGEAVAKVHLPHTVPMGFHGNWLPDSASSERG